MSNEKSSHDNRNNSNISVDSAAVPFSLYAQGSLISATKIDMTFEFIYVNSHTNNGHVVSRVTMPLISAKELAESVNAAFKSLENSSDKED